MFIWCYLIFSLVLAFAYIIINTLYSYTQPGPVGGQGGGAVDIRCGHFTNGGSILANGAIGGNFNTAQCSGAGGGSGGCISIIAAVIVHEGTSIIEAVGGAGGAVTTSGPQWASAGGQGGHGRIRILATQRSDGQPRKCVPAPALV